MPCTHLLKSFSIVALSALVGYGSVKYFQQANSPNRYLASMKMGKMASEQFSKTVFDIQVKNLEIGITEKDISTVQVSIDAFKPLPAGLSFSWNLPDDVSIVEGTQQGFLTEFSANQIQTLVLKIKGYNKTKKSFLSFSLTGSIDNVSLHREALLSSRPEDSFEYVVQQYEKSKQADAKSISKLGKSEYKSPIDLKNVIH